MKEILDSARKMCMGRVPVATHLITVGTCTHVKTKSGGVGNMAIITQSPGAMARLIDQALITWPKVSLRILNPGRVLAAMGMAAVDTHVMSTSVGRDPKGITDIPSL